MSNDQDMPEAELEEASSGIVYKDHPPRPVRTAGDIADQTKENDPVVGDASKDKGEVFVALDELDNAIKALDNQLANFYDDIKPVLSPEPPGVKSVDPSPTEKPVSEITMQINGKRDLINRIAAHLRETRNRIEL